jgi:hypothetical protein
MELHGDGCIELTGGSMIRALKRLLSPLTNVALLVLALLLITERQASAYLDPGTGSMIFQMLVGGLLASLFMVRVFWSNVKSFVGSTVLRRPRRDADDDFDQA